MVFKDLTTLFKSDFLPKNRIIIADGAMGTEIQKRYGSEKGLFLPDFCNLESPGTVEEVHRGYITFSEIITTNTINSNRFSIEAAKAEYSPLELNRRGSQIAVKVAADFSLKNNCRRLVAGSMGPTPYMLSRKQDGYFNENSLTDAYKNQTAGLIEGGVDFLLIETIIDAANLKAAIAGAKRAMDETGLNIPIALSFTASPAGIIPSGHSILEIIPSLKEFQPLFIGLNCVSNTVEYTGLLEDLSVFDYPLYLSPNAGIPDSTGSYPVSPEEFVNSIAGLLENKKTSLRIVGGCCGTTPEHIRRLRDYFQ